MNKRRECLRCELFSIWYTGKGWYLIAALFLGIIGVYLLGYSNLQETWDSYQDILTLYAEEEGQLMEDLQEESRLKSDGNVLTIENPARYYRDRLEALSSSLNPEYASSLACESSMVLFPILFGLFGFAVTAMDHKNRTIRIKVTRFGKKRYAAGKLISLAVICVGTVIMYYVMFPAAGMVIKAVWGNHMPAALSAAAGTASESDLLQGLLAVCAERFLLSLGIAFGFGALGTCIACCLKGGGLGLAVLLLYTLQPVNLRWADLASYFQTMSENCCAYKGVINMVQKPINAEGAGCVCGAAFMIAAVMFVYREAVIRRSAYR